jgi:hypothetical protein
MPSTDTQFKPGEPSANPGGRPKGFANRIKELCGEDYDKIARGFAVIAWGTAEERQEFFGVAVKVSAKDRLIAMRELRDSGPGRPVQTLEHLGDVPTVTRVIHENAPIPDARMPRREDQSE